MLTIFEMLVARKKASYVPSVEQDGHRGALSAEGVGASTLGVSLNPGEDSMMTRLFVALAFGGLLLGGIAGEKQVQAGETSHSEYKVLAPIRHGNLTVFPVVASSSHNTQQFLTLDEGLRSGEVIVSEAGAIRPMVRRRSGQVPPIRDGAQVNQLMLVNNSSRPLLLLAGEIVSGGKQDRVIAKDRIVPAESDPIDLGVFCVEPGRWVGSSSKFYSSAGMASAMAAPGVRGKAMADKDQQKVWSEVGKTRTGMIASIPAQSETVEVQAMQTNTSYAKLMDNKAVQKQVDSVAAPMESDYRSLIKQLRDRNAVGVVVAVGDEIIWADMFASTDLLQKYWPKLVRSYAAEAIVTHSAGKKVDGGAAQAFLEQMNGRHESVESEPGVYRHTEITGDGFKVFELTSLLPKTGFELHVAKMAEN
jgi:ARG/rhodanese/phosphatase superfamily protein